MSMFSCIQKDKYKTGFSLAETVVAIAVVMIISFTSITAVIYGQENSRNNSDKMFYSTTVSNFVKMYIKDGFIDFNNEDVFENKLISFYFEDGFYYEINERNVYLYFNSSRKIITSKDNKNNAKVRMDINLEDDSFFIKVKYIKNNRVIYQMKNKIKRASI